MTGDDVREVFEAILPQEEINRLCVDCDVIARQRKMNLGMSVRAMVSQPGRRAEPTKPTPCGRIWSVRCPR